MFLDYYVLNCIFGAIIAVFIAFRVLTPVRTKANFLDMPVNDYAESLYRDSKSHNITLAAFSIAVLALILSSGIADSSPDVARKQNFEFGIAFISLATFFFFIASYTFVFLKSRRFPYIGQTLEYAGIIALGMRFLNIIRVIVPESILLNLVLYPAFLIALLSIAGCELYLNFRHFHPKQQNVSKGQ